MYEEIKALHRNPDTMIKDPKVDESFQIKVERFLKLLKDIKPWILRNALKPKGVATKEVVLRAAR